MGKKHQFSEKETSCQEACTSTRCHGLRAQGREFLTKESNLPMAGTSGTPATWEAAGVTSETPASTMPGADVPAGRLGKRGTQTELGGLCCGFRGTNLSQWTHWGQHPFSLHFPLGSTFLMAYVVSVTVHSWDCRQREGLQERSAFVPKATCGLSRGSGPGAAWPGVSGNHKKIHDFRSI